MAAVDDIQTSINQVAALIAQITAAPQPSYTVQGVSFSWSEYLSMLVAQQKELQECLILLSGPYQFITQAVS